jgi:predicted O-linked N-acetylglucosamine transferase (SPINDLY family)
MLGQEARALASYRQAVAGRPKLADAVLNLASGLAAQGHYRDALAAYDAAALAHPGDARVAIRRALAMPQVCDGIEEIAGLRAGIEGFLDSETAAELRVDDPVNAVGAANFYLVYHGLDDRPLAERIARFHRRSCPRLSWTAPHCRDGARHRPGARPRIGICSKYLNRHTIGLLFGGVIKRIAGLDEFEVVILRAPGRHDAVARRIDAAADRVVRLPNDLARAQEAIAEVRLDVLLYTDIGMEPLTYFLAFARLAPVQLVTWGHPVTTGLDSLDGYLSTDAFEPPDGAAHYTEGLHRLRHILMHYTPPDLVRTAGKEDFGLPAR